MATPLLFKVSRFKSSYFPYYFAMQGPPLPKFGVIMKQLYIKLKQQPGYLSWTSAGLLSGSRDCKTSLKVVLLHLSTDDHGVFG